MTMRDMTSSSALAAAQYQGSAIGPSRGGALVLAADFQGSGEPGWDANVGRVVGCNPRFMKSRGNSEGFGARHRTRTSVRPAGLSAPAYSPFVAGVHMRAPLRM